MTEPAGAPAPVDRADPPVLSLSLWPHRSLSRRGFWRFMGLLAAGLAIPIVALWGTAVAWFLLPFVLAALGLVWLAIAASNRQGRVHETVRLWRDLIVVERTEPSGGVRRWSANPHWVRVELRDTRQLADYLTLSGGGRTIELGAFLTAEERVALAGDLRAKLAAVAVPGRPAGAD
jgi:uncharacterized membrane protein